MGTDDALILASGSPRRRELLSLLGIDFQIRVPEVDELPGSEEIPANVPQRISRLKAEHVARQLERGIVVAADTVVVHRCEVLGKPWDADHAGEMLRRLRGQRHYVLSGVTVLNASTGKQITDLCESKVLLRDLEENEIRNYVASGDPLDKAAAYAIQNIEYAPVAKVVGCPANVMGLPMCHVVRNLRRLGITLPNTPPTRCEIRYGYTCALTEYVMPGAGSR